MISPKLLAQLDFIIGHLQRKIALNEAIGLAIEERTGQPSYPEQEYTFGDLARAREIMAACWDCDIKRK